MLEITKDSLMVDAEQSLKVLERLHDQGVELSVDDYGTGFSSLAYLRDLPVNELKLDRAFLAAADTDDRAVAIIRSTVDLAHSLDLRIVAEGVETDANLALVAELGCDAAQGYLPGRPAPAEALFPVSPTAEATQACQVRPRARAPTRRRRHRRPARRRTRRPGVPRGRTGTPA